jgi:hypothetical protein
MNINRESMDGSQRMRGFKQFGYSCMQCRSTLLKNGRISLTCLLRALKSLAEKEELDMDRVRLPNDADTDRVMNGGCPGGVVTDVVIGGDFVDFAAAAEPAREEEEL